MASLYGSAHHRDGSRIDGTATISTSWNSNKGFPHKGQYRLDLESNPRQKITVYVNGSTYAEVHVEGDTPLDIHL